MRVMFDDARSHEPLGRRSGRWLSACAALLVMGVATFHPGTAPARAPSEPSTSLRPEGPGKVSGKVVGGNDKMPVAGAVVFLLHPTPQGQDYYVWPLPLHQIKSDDGGAFVFDGLPPGTYRVWANHEDRTSRKASLGGLKLVVREAGDGPKPVVLQLEPAPTIKAWVKDKATGKPIPGATVALGWSDFLDPAKADARGVALVRPLTKERWQVEVWADGYAKATRSINLENGFDTDETFALEPGTDIEGVVRDSSGKPLAKVGLSAVLKGGNTQLKYVESDAQGRFRLPHLPRDKPLEIHVSKDDFERKTVETRVKGLKRRLEITIGPRPDGGSIVGIVRDPQGKPIAGAELRNTGNSTSMVREAKTGADGRFRMDNLFDSNGAKDVLVKAKGCAAKRVKVEPGTREKPAEMAIDLEAGHRVRGRVVDEKGQPLSGVWVDFDNGRNAFTDGGRMTTGDDGKFAFDTLPPNCPFGFSKAGYSDIQNYPLALDGDGAVEVAMAPAGVILGKVLDAATGKPIKAFNVQITFSPKRQQGDPSGSLSSNLTSPGQGFRSDEGEFKVSEMVAGMPLQVTVSAEGYEKTAIERIEAARSDQAQAEEFRLERLDPKNLLTYPIRLVDAEGKAAAGAQLRLIAGKERAAGARRAFPYNWQMISTGQIAQQAAVSRFLDGVSDASGKFTFEDIPKGMEVELVWWGKGVVPGRADHLEEVERKQGEVLEVATAAPARVSGTIDRKAFAGAGRIRLEEALGEISYDDLELKPDQADFEFEDLAPGTYTITLSSAYERTSGGGLTSKGLATKKVTIAPGETVRVDFKN